MSEVLGAATFPSGDLLLIDFGLLRIWSGGAAPELAEGLAPPDVVAAANESMDFEIVGPDAAAVAARVDLAAVKGRYAFDVPGDGELVTATVAEICAETGLDASVRTVPRMPHHTRVQRLLDDLPGGAEVPYFGGWAVAVRGLPADRRLPVLGERMDPDGPDAGKWHSVWVRCADGEPAKSIECGYVLVDEARLMFADPTALNGWRSDEPLDGLADVVFWGRDAATVAERVRPPEPSTMDQSEVLGWTDLPGSEMLERGRELDALQADGELLFRFDVRPHDDHYRVLRQMYSSPAESGSIEVGGALVTGWFTSWGDGAFPVYRDLAADGTLLRVRVELGAPEIVQRQRRFERLWFGDLAKVALVSARVARDGAPVSWLYREEPDNDQDSGWRVFAGDESQSYLDDAANCVLVPLRELINLVPERVFDEPAPVTFERDDPDGDFVPAER